MTIVGRSKIDHPSLGTMGGSTLHAQIENIYANIGNHLAGRFFSYSSIANSTVTTIDHNFGAQFADYKILLYTGSHPNLVRVADPAASGWTIAATSGFEKTKIDVTAPSTGGPHTFAIFMTQGRGAEKLKDLDDINFGTAPAANALLLYDASTSKWLPTTASTGAFIAPSGTTAQRPGSPVNGLVRYNTDTSSFEGYSSGAWSSLGGGGTVDRVSQASHGFVVGDILYLVSTTYTKARADAANTAEVVGMVSRVVDTGTFEITLSGEVSGLSGLTAGEVYFLSAATAGAMTVTEPSVIGQVSVPLGVASSTTTFYVAPKRGNVIGGTNARTSISLNANTTGNIQDVSSYEAGELSGWISITATTSLRFYVSAPFAKNGAANNWNISPSYVGDTPPSGFSISITAAGVIQYTMPSTSVIPGYSAGSINYGLNVPAVGATFPLSISGTNVVNGTPTLDTINEYTSTNGVQIKGRSNNTAIATGYIGEKIEKKTTAATAFPGANGGWGDATFSDTTQTITLGAGQWSITAVAYFSGGSGIEQYYLGIGTAAGASASDISLGDNGVRIGRTASADTFSLVVPNYVVNINASTSYRLKLVAYYPGAGSNPNYQCRLTAIRIA